VSNVPVEYSWSDGAAGAGAGGVGGVGGGSGGSGAGAVRAAGVAADPGPAARGQRWWQQQQQAAGGAPAPQHEAGAADGGGGGGGDGGGSFTCVGYDPASESVPANATIIRRLVLTEPLKLPGSYANVSAPPAAAVAAAVAARFGVPPGTLRPAAAPAEADAVDGLGLRHLRLEQVQEYMGELFG
jgi:hypothetical protein